MIGFHFTTFEFWQVIQNEGLKPSLNLKDHPGLEAIQKYMKDGGIWLYERYLTGHELFGMLIYVAVNHGSDRIVRLAVEYEEWQSASWLAVQDQQAVSSILHHDFHGAGHYGHFNEPFEIVVTPVEANRIRLVNSWNLMDILGNTQIQPENEVAGVVD